MSNIIFFNGIASGPEGLSSEEVRDLIEEVFDEELASKMHSLVINVRENVEEDISIKIEDMTTVPVWGHGPVGVKRLASFYARHWIIDSEKTDSSKSLESAKRVLNDLEMNGGGVNGIQNVEDVKTIVSAAVRNISALGYIQALLSGPIDELNSPAEAFQFIAGILEDQP